MQLLHFYLNFYGPVEKNVKEKIKVDVLEGLTGKTKWRVSTPIATLATGITVNIPLTLSSLVVITQLVLVRNDPLFNSSASWEIETSLDAGSPSNPYGVSNVRDKEFK